MAVQTKEVGSGHLIQQQKAHLQKRLQTLENQLDRVKEKEKAVSVREEGEAESWDFKVASVLSLTFCFQATSQFSSQLVINSQLREDLETLQIGHDRFEQLYKKLDKVGL